jgi:DNA-binding NarL/FixJ family response regulator
MKVLIIEDSPVIYKRLGALLRDIPGMEIVGHIRHALEAIEAIHRLHPEALILDIRLASGNGITVLRHVKKELPLLRIIILTNAHFPQYRMRCLEAGADFFFDKATEFNRIPEVFAQWMRNDAGCGDAGV